MEMLKRIFRYLCGAKVRDMQTKQRKTPSFYLIYKRPPKKIKKYNKLHEQVIQFVEDCIVFKTGAKIRTEDVYKTYADWCSLNNKIYHTSFISLGRVLRMVFKVKKYRIKGFTPHPDEGYYYDEIELKKA